MARGPRAKKLIEAQARPVYAYAASMDRVYFITHPEVEIDAALAVTAWALSPLGQRRMRAFAELPLCASLVAVYASAENKARQAAQWLADRRVIPVHVVAALGENDRSSTGFLSKPDFEAAADAFFADPHTSFRGWETAHEAQSRIVRAVARIVREAPAGDLAIVSHGAVGTLNKCWLKQTSITRREDQPHQGHYYSFERASGRLREDWTPLPGC